ncbi:TolC family protein [Chryseobacterium salivictor]|uniref:Cobalt-zinc-cadmium resistance protein CzcC n=1 Tax=Chryseobacterium salivictor TaxID=2547600 RepID=A0A4P6ZF88_9FLAO|nr:TolC family protein [Chryseobacterium salivictor]QBO58286.1 Cobalt-zinc-cadmium resistance protein CzcC [Chryseobacterium salivictor]
MNRILVIALLISSCAFSQKKITLQQAEQSFVKNNLQLIAQQYNISAADADIVQAKIWELPQASFEANVFSPENNTFFNLGPSKSLALQQLFLLGGKRKNEIEFARSNKELSQLQFNQLLFELKSQLRETFYSIYFDQRKLENLDGQLAFLTDLVKAYKVQTAKGNIALKDEVRLQTMVLALNNEKFQIRNAVFSQLQNLHTLTGISDDIIPEMSEDEVQILIKNQPLISLNELKKIALEHNADYLYGLKSIENSKSYYKWQKSLNIPDVTGGLQWNQNSGIFKNEINFTVAIPIPLWKQNQGNVQKAQILVEQSQKNTDYQKQELENKITAAYQNWQNNYTQYFGIELADLNNLNAVYKGMQNNFRKGNITLMDFTDFSNSYKETVLQIDEIKKQVVISAEQLNQLIQTPIFN